MSKEIILLITSIFLFIQSNQVKAQQSPVSAEKQIAAAVSPAPKGMRAEAAVKGYNQSGELVTLRKGSNKLVCLADDPNQNKFHVSCYYKALEPFMERGRQLRAKGMGRLKVDSLRREEIEAGKLDMPEKPMALYSLTGPKDGYDYETKTVKKASPLYVVYIPYATKASTGLSQKPATKGAPWIMEPGKPWTHIMISTNREISN